MRGSTNDDFCRAVVDNFGGTTGLLRVAQTSDDQHCANAVANLPVHSGACDTFAIVHCREDSHCQEARRFMPPQGRSCPSHTEMHFRFLD